MSLRALLRLLVLLAGISLAQSCLAVNQAELTLALDDLGTPLRDATLQIVLLNDATDLLKQIEALQNQSKPELEPLVKRYMYAAEMLTRFAMQPETTTPEQKNQMVEIFYTSERGIQEILARYRTQIDTLLQQQTVRTHSFTPLHPPASGGMKGGEDCCNAATVALPDQIVLTEVTPGTYRLHCLLTFATTTYRWFAPIVVKGGDRQTVTLTRENLKNPYWTDLNWWSFMNLDFSKHH